MGDPAEEAEVPVRKFTIRKGRVVPEPLKPSGIVDRAKSWTERPSWFPWDFKNVHTGNRSHRLSLSDPFPWPISKYNSMRQHGPLMKQVESLGQVPDPRKVRESKGLSTRGNNKVPTTLKTPSSRVVPAVPVVDTKPHRPRADKGSAASNVQVRKMARSLQRAYDGPSPHTRSKVNPNPPAIVVTAEPTNHHHYRSNGKLAGASSTNNRDRRSMRSVPRGAPKNGPRRPKGSSISTLQLPNEPINEGAQPRKTDGRASANGTPVESAPSPDFPQPLIKPVEPRVRRADGALKRSQNTVRRKRYMHSTHPAAESAGINPGGSLTATALATNSKTPPGKEATESPSKQSRTSAKSIATFASSEISDTYILGRATPVPIVPASRARRDKPLPMLPVAEDPEQETNETRKGQLPK